MFAANSSFGVGPLEARGLEELVDRASLVKRSEIAFNWIKDGRIICASGSFVLGSWIPSTLSAVNTRIGISCVTIVSRSRLCRASRDSSRKALSPNGSCAWLGRKPFAVCPEDMVLVMIVRERTGCPSFFVRRMEAEEAFRADLRARFRGRRGSSRLIVLWSALDWMM